MTATPIPRSLAITLFGDLDVSIVHGLPPGRTPISTRVVPTADRADLYSSLAERAREGSQIYIVAPAIDPSDQPSPGPTLRSVTQLADELSSGPFAGITLAALHGRMDRDQRDDVMQSFRADRTRILIATTVIEVGVDVPNASIMVVENAERFGLAQLHQLRGRVGRGSKSSFCYLIADPATPDAFERLRALETLSDGFAIAEKDFELRGPGDLFSTRQSGLPPLRVADLSADRDLLLLARTDAATWVARSPNLDRPPDALLRRRLLKAAGPHLGLADVG